MKHLSNFYNFKLLIEGKKYNHINFIPPKTVSIQAKKGLKYRNMYKARRGEVSVIIANKLKKRDKITPPKIKQMCTFFSKYKNRNVLKKYKSEPWKDKKYVRYLLWGGDSGRAWSEKIRTQIARADKK